MKTGERIKLRLVVLAGSALLLLCVSLPAHAQRIALESYIGNRSASVAPVADLLRKELKASYLSDPAAVAQILIEHPTSSGMQNPRYSGDLFMKEVSDGSTAWSNTDFIGAQKRLDAAISNARQNPVVIAGQPQAQEALRRALMLSALVHKRLAEKVHLQALQAKPQAQAKLDAEERDYTAKRDARMGELLRSFATPVTRNEFGKEAEQLYLETVQAFAGMPRGKLVVALVDPVPLLTFSVNESTRQPGVITDLLPGPYRLLVQTPGGAREYAVEVKAGQTTDVTIDWNLDSMIETREWVGFRFPVAASLELEATAIKKLLRRTPKVEAVATFTITPTGRKFTVTASLYSATGTLLRRGKLELDSATAASNPERLRNLVAFLEGREAAGVTLLFKGVDAAESPTVAIEPPSNVAVPLNMQRSAPRSRSLLVPKLLVGIGVASMVTGGVLMLFNQPETFAPRDQPQPRLYYSTLLPGGLLLGGGAMMATLGVYLWKREPQSTTLIAAPTQGGAVIGLIHGF